MRAVCVSVTIMQMQIIKGKIITAVGEYPNFHPIKFKIFYYCINITMTTEANDWLPIVIVTSQYYICYNLFIASLISTTRVNQCNTCSGSKQKLYLNLEYSVINAKLSVPIDNLLSQHVTRCSVRNLVNQNTTTNTMFLACYSLEDPNNSI